MMNTIQSWAGLGLIACLSLGIVGLLPPALSFAQVTLQVYPSDDAYVDVNDPDETFGVSDPTNLKVHHRDTLTEDKRTYLQFFLHDPGAFFITSATLHLYTGGGGTNVLVRAHHMTESPDCWREMTITWNNRPTQVDDPADQQTILSSGWYAWDVTADVIAAQAADSIYTVLMMTETSTTLGCTFSSKEGTHSPYLEIEGYFVLGIGACCLGDECYEMDAYECWQAGGVFAGVGVECDDEPCSMERACCYRVNPWGPWECQLATPTGCSGLGGIWWIGLDSCDDNPCASARPCCSGIDCYMTTYDMCMGAPYYGEWHPEAESCDGSENPCRQYPSATSPRTWGCVKAIYR